MGIFCDDAPQRMQGLTARPAETREKYLQLEQQRYFLLLGSDKTVGHSVDTRHGHNEGYIIIFVIPYIHEVTTLIIIHIDWLGEKVHGSRVRPELDDRVSRRALRMHKHVGVFQGTPNLYGNPFLGETETMNMKISSACCDSTSCQCVQELLYKKHVFPNKVDRHFPARRRLSLCSQQTVTLLTAGRSNGHTKASCD